MALESEEIQQLAQALIKGLTGLEESVDSTADVFKKTDNLVKKFNKDLKEIQPESKLFRDMLSGNRQKLEDMSEAAKNFDSVMKKLVESGKDVEAGNVNMAKQQTLNKLAQVNARAAVVNFAIGLGGVAKTMLSGATEFVKGLQGNAEGTELAGQAALRAAESTGKVADVMGSLAEAIGFAMAILPFGRAVKIAGTALAFLGLGAKELGSALSESVVEGVKILNTELEKNKKAFQDITSTGAEFAGGMTELRKVAANAGLDIAQLGTITKGNTENLSNMGLGIAESIKRFGGINKELRNGQLGDQLRKLGLNTEEQAEMVTLTSSMLNASGRLRSMSDKEVAATTVQYTKDLKVLQNITGEDAKKKAEEARQASLRASVMSAAAEIDSEKGLEKFRRSLERLPDFLQTGALEKLVLKTISDPATAILIGQVPLVGDFFNKFQGMLSNTSLSADDMVNQVDLLVEEMGVFARKNPQLMREIDVANLALKGNIGDAAGSADMFNKLIKRGITQDEGTVEATKNAVELAAKNQEAFDSQVAAMDETRQKLKADLGTALTGPLTVYTGVLATGTEAVKDFETAIRNATEAAGGTTATQNKKAMSEVITPPTGSVEDYNKSRGYPSMPTNTGKPIDLFDEIGKVLAPTEEQKARRGVVPSSPGFAQGGISTGPMSGYSEVLHGTEAVVPLPDNRSIPVTLTSSQSNSSPMDTKEMVSAINQQTGLLNRILVSMEKNNQLTSGILQTSY